MTYISRLLRTQVTERAKNRCEYCLIHQEDSFYPHEVDHIIPEKHRGDTISDNLCLSCLECNRFKGSDFASFDPESDAITLLYNPRKDIWSDHFRIDNGRIEPLTATGRVTIFVLNMNAKERVQGRTPLMADSRYPRN